MQSLSLMRIKNIIKAASDHISRETEREYMEEALVDHHVREQGEGVAVSADEAGEEQESERESEEETQAQSSEKASTSEHIRRQNSATRAQLSTASASSGKPKKRWITNSLRDSINKRQKQRMWILMKISQSS